MASTRLERGLRATFLGMVANILLAAAKLVAGIVGHSHALVADAVESLADLFSSVIVWRGLVVAAEPADEDHPYGHGKAEPIAAAAVSTMLLLAAVWITVQAFRGIGHPRSAPAPFTLLVLLVVIVMKEGLFRLVLREAISVESSAVETDAWHHRSDVITSLAAAIGISVALVGGKGYESADDVAAIVAAVMIAWNGWRLLRPAMNELMDRAPSRQMVERIRQIAQRAAGAVAVADGVTLIPTEDATISEKSLDLSLGSATTLDSGTTGPNEGLKMNRALLKFDLTGIIPSNALVTSAALTLTVLQAPTTTNLWFSLHKVLRTGAKARSLGPTVCRHRRHGALQEGRHHRIIPVQSANRISSPDSSSQISI